MHHCLSLCLQGSFSCCDNWICWLINIMPLFVYEYWLDLWLWLHASFLWHLLSGVVQSHTWLWFSLSGHAYVCVSQRSCRWIKWWTVVYGASTLSNCDTLAPDGSVIGYPQHGPRMWRMVAPVVRVTCYMQHLCAQTLMPVRCFNVYLLHMWCVWGYNIIVISRELYVYCLTLTSTHRQYQRQWMGDVS